MINAEKMKALADELRKGSSGRYRWYAMGRDETSYFMDFDWGYDADRWFADQQKSRSAWIEQEGIHIVKKLFQTELETKAAAAADAIDLLLAEVEALQTCKLCRSTGPDVPCAYPTEINRQQAKTINALRAELEAAAADKRDAERYRFLRHADLDELAAANWKDGQVYEGEALDAAIDEALAQRQGEGS